VGTEERVTLFRQRRAKPRQLSVQDERIAELGRAIQAYPPFTGLIMYSLDDETAYLAVDADPQRDTRETLMAELHKRYPRARYLASVMK
jgi:hypothetical protein